MHQIPNIITSVRLFSALVIALGCAYQDAWQSFIYWFVAAGLSDMLDGAVARRFNWCTKFGAHLDSVSDLMLYLSVFVSIFAHRDTAIEENLLLILVGALLQASHILYSFKKFKSFPAYHTTLSRCSAYAIFFFVVFFWFSNYNCLITQSMVLWAVCSLEGLLITRKLKTQKENVAGLWAI